MGLSQNFQKLSNLPCHSVLARCIAIQGEAAGVSRQILPAALLQHPNQGLL